MKVFVKKNKVPLETKTETPLDKLVRAEVSEGVYDKVPMKSSPSKPTVPAVPSRRTRIVSDLSRYKVILVDLAAHPEKLLKVMEVWSQLPAPNEDRYPEFKNDFASWKDDAPVEMQGEWYAVRFLEAVRKAKGVEKGVAK